MTQRLQGKVAVVTGGSRGIGAAIAERLAADGAAVVVNYARGSEAAEKVVKRIQQNGGRAVAVKADVARREDVRALFEAADKAFGPVDVLVNNAGVAAFAPLDSIDDAHIEHLFGTNVRGVIYATQEAARRFGERGGRVVNLSSVLSEVGLPATAVYSASKGALDTLTKTFAAELGSRKISVNAVAPGAVETDMYYENGVDGHKDAMVQRTPLGRIGQPKDVADVVAFLSSDEAGWITGQVVRASGGFNV